MPAPLKTPLPFAVVFVFTFVEIFASEGMPTAAGMGGLRVAILKER